MTHDVEGCPGCRPMAFNLKTNKVLPDDDPLMRALGRGYDRGTAMHRRAWHRVTCLNSRTATDLKLAQELIKLMQDEANKGDA